MTSILVVPRRSPHSVTNFGWDPITCELGLPRQPDNQHFILATFIHILDLSITSIVVSAHTTTSSVLATKMPAPQSAQFKKAVEDSRKLKQKPSDTELLDVRDMAATPYR